VKTLAYVPYFRIANILFRLYKDTTSGYIHLLLDIFPQLSSVFWPKTSIHYAQIHLLFSHLVVLEAIVASLSSTYSISQYTNCLSRHYNQQSKYSSIHVHQYIYCPSQSPSNNAEQHTHPRQKDICTSLSLFCEDAFIRSIRPLHFFLSRGKKEHIPSSFSPTLGCLLARAAVTYLLPG
jgi:hypothetical protein